MSDDSDDLIFLRDHLIWLQKELFDEYEPNKYESFDDCLAKWLSNVDDEDARMRMFKLLGHMFFVGKKQSDALSRSAFSDQTTRWLVDTLNLDITDPKLKQTIDQAVRQTWFCPITDSLRINGFLKVNGLHGHSHRPDWRSLEQFGDAARVRNYVVQESIERLVLLEDFVGTGSQMSSTVRWASQTLPNVEILVIPLICCPEGVATGERLAQQLNNVTFSATLSLRHELFIQENPQQNEPNAFSEIRDVIQRVQGRLGVWQGAPYGYGGTGALVALYSNCPDNTLPLVHSQTDTWNPLFSRIRRS
ncbi:hypothetical protein [Roseovarius sp.]|uniref:phosphoribosyltransferase-like protein n=1 Tax=Roseovarius sp. TaxID=1486281 RepID=UPI003A9844AD